LQRIGLTCILAYDSVMHTACFVRCISNNTMESCSVHKVLPLFRCFAITDSAMCYLASDCTVVYEFGVKKIKPTRLILKPSFHDNLMCICSVSVVVNHASEVF